MINHSKAKKLSMWIISNIIHFLDDLDEGFKYWLSLTTQAFLQSALYSFLRHPVQTIDSVMDDLFKSPEKPSHDTRRYFVSAKGGFGRHGFGKYTKRQILVMDGPYTVEIQELMLHRKKEEPYFLTGYRHEIMAYVKGLTNEMFDNAKTLDWFREERIRNEVTEYCDAMKSPQHTFRHWLGVAVDSGKLVSFDGYILKDTAMFVDAPDVWDEGKHSGTLMMYNSLGIKTKVEDNQVLAVANCHPNEFLFKYFESWQVAARLKLVDDVYTLDALACKLMKIVMLHNHGIGELEFPRVNEMIRDVSSHEKGLPPAKIKEFDNPAFGYQIQPT